MCLPLTIGNPPQTRQTAKPAAIPLLKLPVFRTHFH